MILKQKRSLEALSAAVIGKIASLYKLSWFIGSLGGYLSASSMCMPLVGFFGGAGITTAVWSVLFGLRVAFCSPLSLSIFAFYIPGYCAALYFAIPRLWYRMGLPLFCILLFCVHPVAGAAWVYSVYWLIPIVVALSRTNSFYIHTLGATFTAHAIGSVIWAYTVPMTVVQWIALIPQVACERLICAASMVVCSYLVHGLGQGVRWMVKSAHRIPISLR